MSQKSTKEVNNTLSDKEIIKLAFSNSDCARRIIAANLAAGDKETESFFPDLLSAVKSNPKGEYSEIGLAIREVFGEQLNTIIENNTTLKASLSSLIGKTDKISTDDLIDFSIKTKMPITIIKLAMGRVTNALYYERNSILTDNLGDIESDIEEQENQMIVAKAVLDITRDSLKSELDKIEKIITSATITTTEKAKLMSIINKRQNISESDIDTLNSKLENTIDKKELVSKINAVEYAIANNEKYATELMNKSNTKLKIVDEINKTSSIQYKETDYIKAYGKSVKGIFELGKIVCEQNNYPKNDNNPTYKIQEILTSGHASERLKRAVEVIKEYAQTLEEIGLQENTQAQIETNETSIAQDIISPEAEEIVDLDQKEPDHQVANEPITPASDEEMIALGFTDLKSAEDMISKYGSENFIPDLLAAVKANPRRNYIEINTAVKAALGKQFDSIIKGDRFQAYLAELRSPIIYDEMSKTKKDELSLLSRLGKKIPDIKNASSLIDFYVGLDKEYGKKDARKAREIIQSELSKGVLELHNMRIAKQKFHIDIPKIEENLQHLYIKKYKLEKSYLAIKSEIQDLSSKLKNSTGSILDKALLKDQSEQEISEIHKVLNRPGSISAYHVQKLGEFVNRNNGKIYQNYFQKLENLVNERRDLDGTGYASREATKKVTAACKEIKEQLPKIISEIYTDKKAKETKQEISKILKSSSIITPQEMNKIKTLLNNEDVYRENFATLEDKVNKRSESYERLDYYNTKIDKTKRDIKQARELISKPHQAESETEPTTETFSIVLKDMLDLAEITGKSTSRSHPYQIDTLAKSSKTPPDVASRLAGAMDILSIRNQELNKIEKVDELSKLKQELAAKEISIRSLRSLQSSEGTIKSNSLLKSNLAAKRSLELEIAEHQNNNDLVGRPEATQMKPEHKETVAIEPPKQKSFIARVMEMIRSLAKFFSVEPGQQNSENVVAEDPIESSIPPKDSQDLEYESQEPIQEQETTAQVKQNEDDETDGENEGEGPAP